MDKVLEKIRVLQNPTQGYSQEAFMESQQFLE